MRTVSPLAGGCVLVVAAAGYGKTTALAQSGGATVDDLHELTDTEQRDRLTSLPPGVAVTIGSRRPLAPSVRALLRGPVRERGPADLALDVAGTAELAARYGIDDVAQALAAHDLTAGWPALLHVVLDGLSRGGAADELTAPGSPLAEWVASAVLASLPADAADALDAAVQLDVLCPELLGELSGGLAYLRRTGLVVPHPRAGRHAALRVVPVVAAVRRNTPPLHCLDLSTAADWYERNGFPLAAAAAFDRCGDRARTRAIVEQRGPEILASGGAAELLALGVTGTRPAELMRGDALRITGDPAGAMRAFAPLLAGDVDAGLAWRAAMVHYMTGEYERALATCDADADAVGGEGVRVAAVRAHALGMLGRADEAHAVAEAAVARATDLGDDGALAAAHTAAANATTRGRRNAHLAHALIAAQRAGDVLQEARVLVNEADALLREARFDKAVTVALDAVRAAERGSPPGLLVTALCNAGDALLRTGRPGAAGFHFERAVQTCRRTGVGRMAMGLWGRGEVDRRLGRSAPAAAAFEEAAELAAAHGDVQVLVPALAGLTRLRLEAGELTAARDLADRASKAATGELRPLAQATLAWVALAEADLAVAAAHAAAALSGARELGLADALVEALEVAAATTVDLAERRRLLTEATALWDRAGAWPDADRLRVLLGCTPGADPATRAAARAAERRLDARAMRPLDGAPLAPVAAAFASVRIRVLGGFEVEVQGRPVPLIAWKSRQARSLVKILAARRGRPVPRLELRDLLWPEDDTERTGHRLSVLLSVIRGVFDPAKTWPVDHFVRSDNVAVCLDLDHVAVDVEDFLRDAAHVSAPESDLAPPDACAALAEVEAGYAGDFLPDDVYEDWATGLREHARAVWFQVLSRLAAANLDAARPYQAVGVLVRVLEADPYDEPSYRALVAALVASGRHGEARRVFDRWAAAMRAIDVPEPDPSALIPC